MIPELGRQVRQSREEMQTHNTPPKMDGCVSNMHLWKSNTRHVHVTSEEEADTVCLIKNPFNASY